MDDQERQWLIAWCLFFVFLCIFGSIVDIVMIVCLFGIGACLRRNVFCAGIFLTLYFGIALGKRHMPFFGGYPSIYSLYIGPVIDPIIYAGIRFIHNAILFVYTITVKVIQLL